MMQIISFFRGKKTYIIAIVGLIYGLIHGDSTIIEVSLLGLSGRAALSNEIVQKIS